MSLGEPDAKNRGPRWGYVRAKIEQNGLGTRGGK